MLTCVYHPIEAMRVVEDDEAARLRASGYWFDSPVKARLYRDAVEAGIKNEAVDDKPKSKKKGK